jgi:hypothetical protein
VHGEPLYEKHDVRFLKQIRGQLRDASRRARLDATPASLPRDSRSAAS